MPGCRGCISSSVAGSISPGASTPPSPSSPSSGSGHFGWMLHLPLRIATKTASNPIPSICPAVPCWQVMMFRLNYRFVAFCVTTFWLHRSGSWLPMFAMRVTTDAVLFVQVVKAGRKWSSSSSRPSGGTPSSVCLSAVGRSVTASIPESGERVHAAVVHRFRQRCKKKLHL